jgi:hypothetical protein
LPHEARREPRPPDLGRFLIFSQLQGPRGGLFPNGRTHPEGYAFGPPERGFSREFPMPPRRRRRA